MDSPIPLLPLLGGSGSNSSGCSLPEAAASAAAQPSPDGPVKRRRRAAATAAATIAANARKARRGAVCVQCRRIRIPCEGGGFPCDRCWRLALPCRPQPAHAGRGGGSSGRDDEALHDSGVSSSSGGGSRAAANHSGDPGPLLELAIAQCSPRAHAELLAQAFVALHAAGRAIRERVLHAMCVCPFPPRASVECVFLFRVHICPP